MRLIDADDLLERFVYADVKTELVNAAHDIIEAAPTIRCADCVHFRRNGWSDEGHDIGVCYAGDVVFHDRCAAIKTSRTVPMLRLQREREAKGMSRNALASLARLSHGRVGQLELGRARPPRTSRELRRLALALGLSLRDAPALLDPDEYSAQCRADYGCSNFIAKPYGERFTAPRDDCGDCRYCADPNDKIPGCDNPVVMKP